jgi:hypothetical protein
MTYEEFLDFVPAKCLYETIYDDSDGRTILVIRMLNAYGMVNEAAKREWVGLTKDEKEALSYKAEGNTWTAVELTEAKLKEKNI